MTPTHPTALFAMTNQDVGVIPRHKHCDHAYASGLIPTYSKDRSFAALRMTTPLSAGRLLHCVRNDEIKRQVERRNLTYGKDTEKIDLSLGSG